MGGFALPALHINPPAQQQDLTSQIGQILALKNQIQNAPLQRQALEQEVQSRTLENQKSQTALKDQQLMGEVMQKWGQPATASPASTPGAAQSSGPDYDELLNLARKSGVSYSTYQGIQQHVLDMKAKAATIAKDDAQTGSANATAMSTKNKMLIDAMTGVMSLPDDQLAQGLTTTAQTLAQKQLLDPQHVQMAQQLAQTGDPAKIRQALNIQITGMGGFNKLLEDAQKKYQVQQEAGKSDPNSIFYAPSQQSVAMGTAPGAAQIQAGEVAQAAKKAGAEAKARMPYELALNAQRQALSQGDPNAAGQLLANHDATLSELKSRGATPDFIAKSIFAAKRLNPSFNPQEDEAQFAVAKSPQQVQFFGSAKSLTDKGGTLDQLAETAKKIPQHQIPVFNSLDDWAKAAAGSGPLAQYAAQVLGVADDYAKVMGGGVGSDASRLSAANLVSAKLSKEGREGAIAGIRGSVNSQTRSRIGDNQVLMRMYGSQLPKEDASPSSGAATPKIGDVKTFPNGRKGVWDGQGYVAQ
jgi:hypothetical protein